MQLVFGLFFLAFWITAVFLFYVILVALGGTAVFAPIFLYFNGEKKDESRIDSCGD